MRDKPDTYIQTKKERKKVKK